MSCLTFFELLEMHFHCEKKGPDKQLHYKEIELKSAINSLLNNS